MRREYLERLTPDWQHELSVLILNADCQNKSAVDFSKLSSQKKYHSSRGISKEEQIVRNVIYVKQAGPGNKNERGFRISSAVEQKHRKVKNHSFFNNMLYDI